MQVHIRNQLERRILYTTKRRKSHRGRRLNNNKEGDAVKKDSNQRILCGAKEKSIVSEDKVNTCSNCER